ncbi:16S rRNA m(7)G-527 methyltransferase [Thermosporothrix hazakensis]|jgi:16S rRNA (guanine527-N7)-methyltransferase|uniref:Ribosomal RNA small subunit methyltransferase G n=2 Tax=Thermosporothrix TaxID=768650 RepID=A0A326U895_THEHA|nr:16S rRNA (guanine(527)-N(7))-methyltransferase RsmG [Thermosporothrix hazakensis]PZW31956.1 16S rRNA m(7)G-527 methyltransferase [Thermosporothrix hazakensis]BBH91573.1 ribosomal RNA small subunit methyltransferase G [Thermosporothrix sp. COM3]GCE49719.1 ribosomal RNA small subunit methyltransferase G [Thermosporothrix hazakensis]
MAEGLYNDFLAGLQQLGIDERSVELFLRYRDELLDWNTRFNLTAIKDPEEVLIKHFLDSLSLLLVCKQQEARLLDIGTGAGFPGLALKLVRPQWRVTLLEATNKKVTFLRHMVEMLHLEGVEVIHGRAEELGQKPEYRASFDIVTARAVSALPVLLEYCAPYCQVGGMIVLPKKGDLSEELASGKRAAAMVGAAFKEDVPVQLPGLDDGRRLLVWEQRKRCPAQYPRTGAAIAKKPLGR